MNCSMTLLAHWAGSIRIGSTDRAFQNAGSSCPPGVGRLAADGGSRNLRAGKPRAKGINKGSRIKSFVCPSFPLAGWQRVSASELVEELDNFAIARDFLHRLFLVFCRQGRSISAREFFEVL